MMFTEGINIRVEGGQFTQTFCNQRSRPLLAVGQNAILRQKLKTTEPQFSCLNVRTWANAFFVTGDP